LTPLPRGFSTPVPLGSGGEAEVLLCWQEDPGRWVAVKIAHPSGRQRLKREADHLSRLAGGPVPAAIGQDLSARRPWLGLTWIEGLPFDELPPDLSVPDRRALAIQAALAVARLHGARVVHGDLSPANLVARPHGEVAILDFGLSPGADGSVPPVEGTWEILPPERLQGGAPDPRWDVFALGVLGLRVLGALPPGVESRESWTSMVASGELAKWARGRSWGLSQALEPDPELRPADAAALVRLLERDWGDPPLDRAQMQLAVDRRMEGLLSRAVSGARSRRDWNSAWRLQRERIERSRSPENLLQELGEFQRLRSLPPTRHLPWAFLAAGLVAVAVTVWWLRRPSDRPSELDVAASPVAGTWSETAERESPADVLVFDPPPPGAVFRIDGREQPPPRDGYLRLMPGTHHVELEDSTGDLLLDTEWIVPRKVPTRRKTHAPITAPLPSTERKGTQ
jgi:serine/threonine-protein kinase